MELTGQLEKVTPIIKTCLGNVKIKGSNVIADDAKYKQFVVDPAWEILPFAIKLIGRERLKWDRIFSILRNEAFVVDGDNVTVNDQVYTRIPELLKRAWKLPTDETD